MTDLKRNYAQAVSGSQADLNVSFKKWNAPAKVLQVFWFVCFTLDAFYQVKAVFTMFLIRTTQSGILPLSVHSKILCRQLMG